MKPVIVIDNYYQNIFITLGEAIKELAHNHKEMQIETLLYVFNKGESHAQCMEIISRYVNIIEQKGDYDERNECGR